MGGGAGPVGIGGVDSQPKAMTFVSIAVVMMGAAMFGADQNNYGVIYGFESFQQHWACNGFQFSPKALLQPVDHPDICPAGFLVDPFCIPSRLHTCECQFPCDQVQSMPAPPIEWANFIIWGMNMVPLGMMCGALTLAPVLSRFLGRRASISIGGITCFLGCILAAIIAGASLNVALYYIGRFLTGFGIGVACTVLPMYNAEMATLNIRGLTGSLFQFMVVLGGFLVIALLGFLSDWVQGFLVPGYLGLAVGLGVWMCPESARFLLDRGKKDQAKAALQRVRAGDVSAEIDFIEQCMNTEREAGQVSWLQLFTTPGLRFRLFVACYLQAAQQFTGVNAMLGYQTDIFLAGGYTADEINQHFGGPAFLMQIIAVVGVITGLVLVDSRYGGRKVQLVGGAMFMGPPLLIAAFTHFAGGPGHVTAVMVFIFQFGFQASWGLIPWFYPAELFQTRERERALAVSSFCGFFSNFCIGYVTKPLLRWS